MPLSTVFVSTVASRPRAWSSYSNIRAKDVNNLDKMNSTEEIAIYKEPTPYRSPILTRRTLGCSYDLTEKSQKKDKKWSISSIFRRKKKDESESSSEEGFQKKGFLRKKKKQDSKRKKTVKQIGTFDHVVISPVARNSLISSSHHDDSGVLSDPTGGFTNYVRKVLPKIYANLSAERDFSKESLNEIDNSGVSLGSGSVDSTARKSRRDQTKARAEARRTSSRNSASSEENSNCSLVIKSEENLRPREGSLNRKWQARTERYLKRHSRDGENPYNYLRLSKSDVENSAITWKFSDDGSGKSPSRSPLVPMYKPSSSGISTIPPSHSSQKYSVINSTSNPSYKPAQSMNEYNSRTKRSTEPLTKNYFHNNQRSISCDANIHKAPSAELNNEGMHVQLPISVGRSNRGYRNLSLVDASQINRACQIRFPPPPPRRDPNRMPLFESARPKTYYFDNSGQSKSRLFTTPNPYSHPNVHQMNVKSFNIHQSHRSTSEDYLPTENVKLSTRPSLITPEGCKPQRFIRTRPDDKDVKSNVETFNYLMDRRPRSRKPILFQQCEKTATPTEAKSKALKDYPKSKRPLEFWKKMETFVAPEETPLRKSLEKENSKMFTSHVQTKIFLPSVVQKEKVKRSKTNTKDHLVKPNNLSEVTKKDTSRKSANLEDALNELEAIYNSLKLGEDEDLLERAEQREKETQNKKVFEANMDPYRLGARGVLSDSNFSYEPFDSVDLPRNKKIGKRNRTADINQDDMAFRKINKERAKTISEPQSVVSKDSYLLASPVQGQDLDDDLKGNIEGNDLTPKEPDITYDDVVFRNIKHVNNSLKVIEPQPPFGIPLGPITPAANSDYLHAKPENDIYSPSFKPRKIPDIVKDDLAFRNLRKDDNKGPALPPLAADDFKINNSGENKFDLYCLKKKRAQRSLSANIESLIQADLIEKARQRQNKEDVENEFKNIADIADAMEIARNVLKEKEIDINATKKAFMSDGESKSVSSSQPISIKESRMNFLSDLNRNNESKFDRNKSESPSLGEGLLSKPPRGLTPDRKARSPKESTPIPISPLEDRRSANSESTSSSLEDLLNSLADKAKETTERITIELEKLGEERFKRNILKITKDKNREYKNKKIFNEKKKIEEKKITIPNKLSAIDSEPNIVRSKQLKEQSHITEKLNKTDGKNKEAVYEEKDVIDDKTDLTKELLKCVVDSSGLMASTKAPIEVVKNINLFQTSQESANLVLTRLDLKEILKLKTPEKEMELEDLEHDYENLTSDKEFEIYEYEIPVNLPVNDNDKNNCKSPFEERKADLIATFRELKQNIEDMEIPKIKDKFTGKKLANQDFAAVKPTVKEGSSEDIINSCRSPFEEQKADLIASFRELKRNIGDFGLPKKTDLEEEDFDETDENLGKVESFNDNLDSKKDLKGERGVLDVVALASNAHECAFVTRVQNNANRNRVGCGHFNPGRCEEPRTYHDPSGHLDSLESLKSPKLVLQTSRSPPERYDFPRSPRESLTTAAK